MLLALCNTAFAFDNMLKQSYTGSRNNYTGRVGYTFIANKTFQIEALGRSVNPNYNNGVLQSSHIVELWDETPKTLLASVMVDSSSPKQANYVFEPLPQWVGLISGKTYMLLSDETTGDGDPWMDVSAVTNYDTSCVTILGGEFGPSSGNPMPAIQKVYGLNYAYVPATFATVDSNTCNCDCSSENTLIDPAGLSATASSTSAYGTPALAAVNGSGMTGETHDVNYQHMWLSGPDYGKEWFRINLGASYALDMMKVWNYNQPPGYNCRGVKQADIYWSNAASNPDGSGSFNPSNWNLLGTAGQQTFTKAPGTAHYDTPDAVQFGGITAHWVTIKMNTYYADSGLHDVGLSQVRFYSTSACANHPAPTNCSTGILTSIQLSWAPGLGAILHEVYFGTALNTVCAATATSPECVGNTSVSNYELTDLKPGTQYYWRIDEVTTGNTYKGCVWTFQTGLANATYLYPANSDTQIYPYHNNLRWSPATAAVSHDVYLGTSYDAVNSATIPSPQFEGNQTALYYDISTLQFGTTYYWRVDEVDASNHKYKGVVHSFTMANPVISGSIGAIEDKMPNVPSPYLMRDWKQVARDYDTLFFNFDAVGQYLPLVCWDTTGYATGRTMFSTRGGYVGIYGTGCTCQMAEELGLVCGSTLCGIDKSYQWCENTSSYQNYVVQMGNFYDPAGGVYAYLPSGSLCCGSGWYIDYSAQMFTELYWLYDSGKCAGDMTGNNFAQEFATQAQRWFQAGQKWGGSISPWAVPTNIPKGIYFPTMAVANDWVSDAPAGYAWIMYMAYSKLKDPNYLLAAEWGLQAILKNTTNPGKEADIFCGPITAARINAEQGRHYDVQQLLNWCMGANHPNGWGVISENGKAYNGYDMHGLIGADWSGSGGGGFAGDTFDAFHRLIPIARYDGRFAHSLGKFALNCANASRLYYGNALPQTNYYSADYNWTHAYDTNFAMPTEVVRMIAYRYNKAVSDYSNTYGTVQSGDYSSTVGVDGVYEVLQEQDVGGTNCALEHVWAVNIQPAVNNLYELEAWGHCVLAGAVDTGFVFSWSTSPTTGFTDLFTVSETSGDAWHGANFSLTITHPATLYIKVRNNNVQLDTLYIDRLEVDQECQWGPEPAGDAVAAGWSQSNLAPYGGHRVGLMAASIGTTDVSGILQLDLLAADVFHDPNAYPTSLYYNPYTNNQTINIDVGPGARDIYDAVSGRFLKTNVSGITPVAIAANTAIVAVLAAASGTVTYNFANGLKQTLINEVVVNYSTDKSAVVPGGLKIVMQTPSTLVISGNGAPGTSCRVLSATNLATPRASWVPVSTNTFDGAGTFAVTNTVSGGDPRRFYLISAP